MSLQSLISQLSQALVEQNSVLGDNRGSSNNINAIPLTTEGGGAAAPGAFDFDNALEYARRTFLSQPTLSSPGIYGGQPPQSTASTNQLVDQQRGLGTTKPVVGSTAVSATEEYEPIPTVIAPTESPEVRVHTHSGKKHRHGSSKWTPIYQNAFVGVPTTVPTAWTVPPPVTPPLPPTNIMGIAAAAPEKTALERSVPLPPSAPWPMTTNVPSSESIEFPVLHNNDRKKRRTRTNEQEHTMVEAPTNSQSSYRVETPGMALPVPSALRLSPDVPRRYNGVTTSTRRPSMETASCSLLDDNSQIIDFRLRIPPSHPPPREENQRMLPPEVLNLLHEILQHVKQINAKLSMTPQYREQEQVQVVQPDGHPAALERRSHRRRSDHNNMNNALQTTHHKEHGKGNGVSENPSYEQVGGGVGSASSLLEYSESVTDRRAGILRSLIPTHFQEIRSVVEEVMGPLLRVNQRSCRVCRLPYTIQRNKDVLEFRCRNAREHETSVYGGRIPDYVLEAAWDVIQERGLDNVTLAVKQQQRRSFRDRELAGFREKQSTGMRDAGEDDSNSTVAALLSQASNQLQEDSTVFAQRFPLPKQDGDMVDRLEMKLEATDIRVVGMEVVSQLLPKEQRTCKVCGDLYSLNRNKGSLEFRCRNNALHPQSLYGGRVPKEVMDEIYEVIRQREARAEAEGSDYESPPRTQEEEVNSLKGGTAETKESGVQRPRDEPLPHPSQLSAQGNFPPPSEESHDNSCTPSGPSASGSSGSSASGASASSGSASLASASSGSFMMSSHHNHVRSPTMVGSQHETFPVGNDSSIGRAITREEGQHKNHHPMNNEVVGVVVSSGMPLTLSAPLGSSPAPSLLLLNGSMH